MKHPHIRLALMGALILTGTWGCDRKPAQPKDPPPPAQLSPKIEEPKPPPWYVGVSEASVLIEGLPSAVSMDEAERRRAAGKDPKPFDPTPGGTLELRISVDENKEVSGSARFGELSADVRGRVEGESLRYRISSPHLNGYGVAQKKAAAWTGTVSFSTIEGKDAGPETRAYRGNLDLPLAKPKIP